MRRFLVTAALSVALGACSAPRAASLPQGLAPGWGRHYSPAAERLSVRAVPAAAAPARPELRAFKPGWGRSGVR